MPAASGRGVASSGRVAMSEIVPSKSRKMPPRRPSDRSRSTNWSEEIAKRYGEGLPVKSAPNTMMTWMFLGKLSGNCLRGTPGKYRLRSRVASGRESGR